MPSKKRAPKKAAPSNSKLGQRQEVKAKVLTGNVICDECKQPVVPGTPWEPKGDGAVHADRQLVGAGRSRVDEPGDQRERGSDNERLWTP